MWNSVKKIPVPTDRAVDVWCVHPETLNVEKGVRFTDVVMRRDGSGFGMVVHTGKGAEWNYLESDEGIYPKWIITHWVSVLEGPRV